jgi:hypothetical protein
MEKIKNHSSSSAKDVFSYLLMIAMLYTGIVSTIALLFQYINVQFPDYMNFYYGGAVEVIRMSMSALLIGWPVFILISWLIGNDLKSDAQKSNIWIRRWMLHLTIFIAAITIIIDLITLVNSFLGGELTIRFGLKVLAILIVAALVFAYELWDLRRDTSIKTKFPMISAIISSVIMLGIIIAGFFIVGSPATQRDIRMDGQRVSDLQSIQYRIIADWQAKGDIPESISDLEDPIYGFIEPMDPETNESYSYTRIERTEFELCATFEHSSLPDEYLAGGYYSQYPVMYDNTMEYWNHDAGLVCFHRTIDTNLYPIEKVK